jgi:hypothetical protein
MENENNKAIYHEVQKNGLSSLKIGEENLLDRFTNFIPNDSLADSSFVAKYFTNLDFGIDPNKSQNSYYSIIYKGFMNTNLYKGISSDTAKKM